MRAVEAVTWTQKLRGRDTRGEPQADSGKDRRLCQPAPTMREIDFSGLLPVVVLVSAATCFQNRDGLFRAAGSGYSEFLSALFIV